MHKIKGLSEREILTIIDRVVDTYAPSFKFGYFDVDDIKQEGRIECLAALPKFEIAKARQTDVAKSLRIFLSRVVRTRYLNLWRDLRARIQPPPCDCEFCTSDDSDRMNCKKYSRWAKRNASKLNLMEPFDIKDIYTGEAAETPDFYESIMSQEVLEILNIHVPAEHRADYRRLIEGASLTKDRQRRILNVIMEVLEEHYGEI